MTVGIVSPLRGGPSESAGPGARMVLPRALSLQGERWRTPSSQATLTFLLRAIRVPLQRASKGSLRAARDRETRSEPGRYPYVRAVPKLTVRVRFPLPAPHAKSVTT